MLEKMLWHQKNKDLFWALSRLPYTQQVVFAPEMVRFLQNPPPESLSEEELKKIECFCADPVVFVVSSLAFRYADMANSKELLIGKIILKYPRMIQKAIKRILGRA